MVKHAGEDRDKLTQYICGCFLGGVGGGVVCFVFFNLGCTTPLLTLPFFSFFLVYCLVFFVVVFFVFVCLFFLCLFVYFFFFLGFVLHVFLTFLGSFLFICFFFCFFFLFVSFCAFFLSFFSLSPKGCSCVFFFFFFLGGGGGGELVFLFVLSTSVEVLYCLLSRFSFC